jgi:ABC-2 type transport system ATP-binding protein
MKAALDEPAIEAVGLRKVYGKKVAVEDFSLTVGRGEVFGFLGPNGAGKTTALKMLLGLVPPTGGTAHLLGRPLGDDAIRAYIGFLPEHFRFHEWMRAEQFLDFHGRLYGISPQERERRIPQALEMVGLAGSSQQRLRTFSKGMLQRIGIAQALLHDPILVFLDEPTSGLDPLGRGHVRDIILRLKAQGTTVFLNSHLLSEAERVCDRVAIINQGRIVRQGALAQLLSSDLEIELRVGNPSPQLLEEIRSISLALQVDGSLITARLDGEDRIPLLAETVVRRGGQLLALTPRRSSLEDYFVQIVESGDR